MPYVSSTCFVEYRMKMLLLCQKDDCFPTTPVHGSILKQKEVDKANQLVKAAMEEKKASARGHHYSNYTETDRARIGKYAARNGIARACRYFTSIWNTNIPESTVRRFLRTNFATSTCLSILTRVSK